MTYDRRSDLSPALGYPGGPCQVVQRINQEVRNPRLRDQLIEEIESGDDLSNPEASKVYDMETERGAGLARRLLIGPHAQYRMDLRAVTVPQVRAALKEFSKQFNDWKSQQSPRYKSVAWDLMESRPVEFKDKQGLLIIFTMEGRDTIKLITTYWPGQRDPKIPREGCPVDYSYDRRTAAALPLRVDKSVVKKLQQDFRRVTKIYKDIPTKADWDYETLEHKYDPSWLAKWQDAERVFSGFRQNIEDWVYKVLIQHSAPKKDSWAQRAVREKAWTFLSHLSGLFPRSWNYRTQLHVDAPWELDQKRDTNIRRYQKSFREFIESLKDLIENEEGVIERAPTSESFELAGMNVVVWNADRDSLLFSNQVWSDKFLRDLSRQAQEIIQAGFKDALDGLTVHVRFDRTDMTAGQYNREKDRLDIFPLGMTAGKGATTFIHEVGHRFYFRMMSNRAQQHWEDVIETRQVKITPEDVGVFMGKIWDVKYRDRELVQLVQRSKFDPETKAKFNYLADHNPAYTSEPKEVGDHHLKFNVGEKVTIEHISDYGATNPWEAFAEAFQLYVRKGPRAIGPWTRDFFERVTRGGKKFGGSPNP